MKSIGIIGGGQLGVMLSESIHNYGGTAHALGPEGSPASRFVVNFSPGDLSSKSDIASFAQGKDAIVLEVEHVDPELLVNIDTPIFPRIPTLEICRHRRLEKEFLLRNHLPHALWAFVDSAEQASTIDFEFPCVSKTTVGGYDGLGQGIQGSKNRLVKALSEATPSQLMHGFVLEELIEIQTEISCIVASDANGAQISFPIIENFHKNHVLDSSVLPAQIPPSLAELATQTALETARLLGSPGLVAVEFFVTQTKPRGPHRSVDGYHLLVNEIAPRPHNSGHLTRCATNTSQFDALARVLLDVPLVTPTISESQGVWAMANLLSDIWLVSGTIDLKALGSFPSVHEFYLYGKDPTRPRRKMGHVTIHESSAEQAQTNLNLLRTHLASRAR